MSHYDHGGWSEWVWQPVHNAYERFRLKSDGSGYEWEYTAKVDTPPQQSKYIPYSPRADAYEGGFSTADNPTGSGKAPVYTMYPYTGVNQFDMLPVPEREITSNDVDNKNKSSQGTFSVHKSSHFKFGKIFKIMWVEPTGQKGTLISGRGGSDMFAKPRRFLIINDNPEGHSICLPILTYSGRGTTKWGCKPGDHAVIYSTEKPKFVHGERKELLKDPVHCKIDGGRHLEPASRLNYTKLYTVEHNVGVEFIGRISKSEHAKVVNAYNSANLPIVAPPDPVSGGYGQQFEGGEAPPTGYY